MRMLTAEPSIGLSPARSTATSRPIKNIVQTTAQIKISIPIDGPAPESSPLPRSAAAGPERAAIFNIRSTVD